MKKLVIALTVFCAAGQALGLTLIGPPAATLDEREYAAGFSYCKSQEDIEVTALGVTVTDKDVKVDTYMANMMLGLGQGWELQVDLGVSETEYYDLESTEDFTVGFAVKKTFWEREKIKWGAALAIHGYRASESGVELGVPWTEEDKWHEVQIAVGPSYNDGTWCLYGGPFLHFIRGGYDLSEDGVDVSGDFEEDSMVGGFVGVQVDLGKNAKMGFEYQRTGSADAIGASILFRF